jgi:DEAD/DEAH box helicase domain-containing protein
MRVVTFDIETADWMSDTYATTADLPIAVVCAHDSETGEVSCYTVPELPQFWKLLEQTDIIVGFNSDDFDIPILNRYYPGDLTRIKSLDLLVEVQRSLGRRIKLDMLAEATLGKKKSGDGLQSLRWWKNGEVEKVKAYCADDVRITRAIFDYALKNGKLKYKDLGTMREFPLDTREWLTASAKPMTFSLGF